MFEQLGQGHNPDFIIFDAGMIACILFLKETCVYSLLTTSIPH